MEKCYENDGLVNVYLPNCSELGVVVLKKFNKLDGPFVREYYTRAGIEFPTPIVFDGEYGSEQ